MKILKALGVLVAVATLAISCAAQSEKLKNQFSFSGMSFMWSGMIMASTMISFKESALISSSYSSLRSLI